jgi:excisionase family DNA binding protein
MLTVPEAARRAGKNPETIRRWIRSGKLRSTRVGTQHMIDESDLEPFESDDEMVGLPSGWGTLEDGSPMPNVVEWVRRSRAGH